ncbi:major capsid protein [Micrococcus lylae]|uniref:major capsid protein n=1 Tax=Micrococcus lylae TaxID=1273 RepID=UPI000C807E66|nr:major capsid protein [Micrococcus lylae]WIK82160.1 major capsid protein [Micrococcus lylae]
MAIWSDIVTPAELTGYVRESAENYEASKGTLARWLPNRQVGDIVARFFKGDSGLVPEANFRAYDAAPEVGARPRGRKVTIDLPALGQNIPVSEYVQLRSRNASDEELRNEILRTADRVVRAVSDRIERQRGIVLATGKATIDQANYVSEDDFGRAPELTLTANTLWSAGTTGRMEQLENWADIYEQFANERAGALVMGRRAARLLRAGDDFRVNTIGATGTASTEQTNALLEDNGLPPIYVYERKTYSGRVLPEDTVLFLPAPVDPSDAEGTTLGATVWGRTLSAQEPEFEIAAEEQPGIVAGVYRHQQPPMIAEVVSDAIGLPVLANANQSMAVKVL